MLTVPVPSLVLLVGASASGKSTFARTHFTPTEVLSSDACRGLVSDDENDQRASADAFDVLHYVAAKRLRRGRLTVVDATNVLAGSRERLLAIARAYGVPAVAIVLDLPPAVLVARDAVRTDRQLGADTIRRQRGHLRRGLAGLAAEGFAAVHVLSGEAEVAVAQVVRAER